MSKAIIGQTIRNFFDTNFSECPYTFENNAFDTPNDIVWVKLNILYATPELTSMGTSCHREWGITDILIFEPIGHGTAEAERIGDIIEDLFRYRTVANVNFKLPQVNKVGLINDFNQTNISVDFSSYIVN